MYKSQEIRWFSKIEHKAISEWFDQYSEIWQTIEPRIDYYLPLPEKEDISIKLREGKVEMKLRTGSPKKVEWSTNTTGFLENWVKWSFELSEADALSKSIIENKKYDWIEVWKKRKGIIVSRGEDGRIKFQGLRDYPPFGCQVEYTRLIINEQEYFTFCLEWFGEQHLELERVLISEILDDSIFKPEESMGYSQFLSSLFS